MEPFIDNAVLIDGWMSTRELEWLAQVASQSKRIIEVGCYKGRSTRAMADNTQGSIICIDPWSGSYFSDDFKRKIFEGDDSLFDEFKQNLKDKMDKIEILRFKFCNLPLLEKADFIFIDGDHHYDEVLGDISHALRNIEDGGIIAGHDYGREDWPGVKKAVDQIFPRINLVDTIWWKKL